MRKAVGEANSAALQLKTPATTETFYYFNHSQSAKNCMQCLAPLTQQKQWWPVEILLALVYIHKRITHPGVN